MVSQTKKFSFSDCAIFMRKHRFITMRPDNVLKVAYLLLIYKIKMAENQIINSYLWCPEQAHNRAIMRK